MWSFPEDLTYKISCDDKARSGPTVRRSWKVRGKEYLGFLSRTNILISYRNSSEFRKL